MVFDFWLHQRGANFLISSALYWLGSTSTACVWTLASMLYLDYNRKQGEWGPPTRNGGEDSEAVAFLRKLGDTILGRRPHKYLDRRRVHRPGRGPPKRRAAGLGFNFKCGTWAG